jgi:DNA primase
VKTRPTKQNLGRGCSLAGPHTSLIFVIALPETKDKADPNKGLFYCYGCRGGDVIRFAELYYRVKFQEAVMLLRQWSGLAPLLHEVFDLYRIHLHRSNEAIAYLDQRGIHSSEVIGHMRIGYAPGRCLRSWLTQLGYPLSVLQQAGLITTAGYDS